MNLPLPQIEGKYEILHKIKEGGMGAIYKVRHLLLEEVRVVKTIRPEFAEDPGLRERFLREAKTAIRLRHPNIAQLYDFAVGEDGTAYIVMEYIDGVTLQEMLAKSGPPAVSLTLEIAHQSLQALGYLHHKGFVHRDVAPDNLMLSRGFDGAPQIKLIDLGIVKRLEAGGADLTATGTFLGKVRYAAPEQFSDSPDAEVGPRSDIYSFGVMLYELLTGRLPYRGNNLNELIAGHLFRAPLDFAETDPEGRVSSALREIVLEAMAKQPAERIASAEGFAARLAPLRVASATLPMDLDATLHSTATLLVERGPVAEPGSTQADLNRQFGLEATPRPEVSKPAPQGPRPRRIETRAEELAALLANAQLLARLEQFDRAKHELDRLLELDPRSREARELLDAVEGALEKHKEAARRKAEEARKRAEEEARKKAEEERRRAQAEAGRKAEEAARKRAEEAARKKAEEDRRRAEAEARKEAEEAARKRAEAEARRKAEEDRIRAEEEEARRRVEAVAAAVTAVEGLLARGEVEEAESRLEAARSELGDDRAWKPVEKAIRKRRTDAEKLLSRARKCAEKDPEEAQRLLWQSLELVPGLAEAQGLLEAVVAAIRERELARAVEEAVQSIGGRIADGELDRADEELGFARASYGNRPEIEEMAAQLGRARTAAEVRRQAEEAAARAAEEARRADEETVAAAARSAAAEPAVEELPPAPDDADTARIVAPRWDETEVGSPPTEGERSRPRWFLGVAAGLLLLVAGALVWYLASSSGETAPPEAAGVEGYLVLDALPWAEVTEIRNADGEIVPLKGPRHTPLRIALPPGTYTILLVNPSAPEQAAVTAEIRTGESTERMVEIDKVEVDEYFERVGL